MDGINNKETIFAPIPAPVGNPIGDAFINTLLGFIAKGKKDNKPEQKQPVVEQPSGLDESVFGKDYALAYNEMNKKAGTSYSALSSKDKAYNLDNPVAVLSQGKFGGVKITKEMVDDVVKSAKKANINPMDLLAVIGQESTFSQEKNKKGEYKRTATQRSMSSGWNTDEPYIPYDLNKFLADKQVPGIVRQKKFKKVVYSIDDMQKVKDAIKSRPGLIQEYIKKVQSTPAPEEDYFDMAAKFIKKKGIQGYNPGDPNYVGDVMTSKSLLQKDPQLMKYLKSINIENK